MTDKHTPGPWETQDAEDDGTIFIIGSNLGGLVGAAHCWPTEVETRGSDRVQANARLIAAAPDMLEALEALRMWMGPCGIDPEIDAAMEKADAAIAKARGQS